MSNIDILTYTTPEKDTVVLEVRDHITSVRWAFSIGELVNFRQSLLGAVDSTLKTLGVTMAPAPTATVPPKETTNARVP